MNIILVLASTLFRFITTELDDRLPHLDLLGVLHLHVLGEDDDALVLERGEVGLPHLVLLLRRGHLAEETALQESGLGEGY